MSSSPTEPPSLNKEKHVKFFKRCFSTFLPHQYTGSDSTRLALACFIISSLDVLSVPLTSQERTAIRRWVLSLQHPQGGFCGSSTHSYKGRGGDESQGTANLAATFFALQLLAIAAEGDAEEEAAFRGVERGKLLRWLRRLQRDDGSFGQNEWDGDAAGGKDTRHSYLASCVRWMVRGDGEKDGEDDETWVEDVDVEKLAAFIRQGQTYDGGIAESSQHESHAGYAYCALGALYLLDRPQSASSPHPLEPNSAISKGIPNRKALIEFLVYRQFAYLAKEEEIDQEDDNLIEAELGNLEQCSSSSHVGFNGRWNKKADTCYCWWTGASLAMLESQPLINMVPSRNYLLDITQHHIGGFAKSVRRPPDIYHSFLGLAALAVMGEDGLKEFDVGLCCTKDTTRKIERARKGLMDGARQKKSLWEDDGFWKNGAQ